MPLQTRYSSWDLQTEEGMICWVVSEVYTAPLSIKKLHEFVTVERKEPPTESYGLRAGYIL